MCGKNKIKPDIDDETKKLIEENQIESNPDFETCAQTIISDKYVLTAAHCVEGQR